MSPQVGKKLSLVVLRTRSVNKRAFLVYSNAPSRPSNQSEMFHFGNVDPDYLLANSPTLQVHKDNGNKNIIHSVLKDITRYSAAKPTEYYPGDQVPI